jgi:ferredoxin-NADP reductase
MTDLVATAPRPSMWKRFLGSRLAAALAYPRGADSYAELAEPLWSSREVRARVVAVRPETADTTTLVMQPNDGWRRHLAGQYVALTVELGGIRRTRVFSLSSAPSRGDGLLEVTFKARPGGAVTPRLLKEAQVGMIVTLSQAQGSFVLPEPLPERVLLISGGSGITPVMAMLRELQATGFRGEVVFLHYARSQADVIFGDELRALAEGAALRVILETEAEAPVRPELTTASLAALVPDYEAWETWVCGPEPLLDAARRAFEGRGAAGRLHTERFSLGSAAGGAGEGSVSFRRSGREAKGQGKALLVLAEQAGLRPASGCRMGICHTCTCRKVAGVTRDLRTGALSTEDDVDIRICVSEPVGPVTLDL